MNESYIGSPRLQIELEACRPSREGQMAWMKAAMENGYDYATLREDLPAERIPAGRRKIRSPAYLYGKS